MARQSMPQSNSVVIVRDANGNEITRLENKDIVHIDANGNLTASRLMDLVELADGSLWNPEFQNRGTPVYAGRCALCVNPPKRLFCSQPQSGTTGLVALHRAKLCTDCGALCCPSHRKLKDNAWRCTACHKKHTRWSLIRPLFFTRKDD